MTALHARAVVPSRDISADAPIEAPMVEPVPRLALRPREAAEALGLGQRKLWELSNRGLIPHVKIGKAVLYPVDALREWLAREAGKQTGA